MSLIIASNSKLKEYAKAIKQGLELSSGAKSVSTYYHSKDEQIQAIRKSVAELYKVDKSIPILLACMTDATHFFRQEVLRHELKSGFGNGTMAIVDPSIWLDQRLQENMINHIISSLPITYALRFFVSFKELKINATRARKKIIAYLLANLNDFTAVKYRDKIKMCLVHAYGLETWSWLTSMLHRYLNNQPYDADGLNKVLFNKYDGDNTTIAKLLLFVEGRGQKEWYNEMPTINAYYSVVNANSAVEFFEAAKKLDITVVIGILSEIKNPLFDTLKDGKKIKSTTKAMLLQTSTVMSDDQKVRTKNLQKKTGAQVRTDIDYSKVQTESLYKTEGVEAAKTERVKQDKISLPYTQIGVIKDISLSNRGGADSANTPAVVIDHLCEVLKGSVQNCVVAETPQNQTDLTKPYIEIMKANPNVEAIFVLSDGYENYPYEGCFSDLIRRSGTEAQIIHCSPFVAAEMRAKSRSLGTNVTSMAVTKPSQITTQMEARLLDFDPRKYFENNFTKFLTRSQRIQALHVEEML